MAEYFQTVYTKYCKSVSCNPEVIRQIESVFRISSYLIAGRYNDSQVLSELVYSASRLMVMLNDIILQQAVKIVPKVPLSHDRIMRLLTVLEYTEVFVELAVKKLWGEVGRWIVITVIQLAKAVLRCLLLIWYQAGIQATPPISPIDRDILMMSSKKLDLVVENLMTEKTKSKDTFVLKRSGKPMRSLKAAPNENCRTWVLPEAEDIEKKLFLYKPSKLTQTQMLAEFIHISRPLVHILLLSWNGKKSWKPWMSSCLMDIVSLYVMGDLKDLNPTERTELKRRTFTLFYYLLRSPFYDRFSEAKIKILLKVFGDSIPGLSHFTNPLISYIPYWQKVYFYLWSS
ncbi:peroxisomal membrane protein PEX16 [Octopus bimaculoides]|uniref:Peroxisomal membrane protein PEX16 n=1 Tax=Octopus bimaculoides TaxID=37653 RepID=A0A0L8GYL8_OCTBM|nr:peroxisomal membrane protein PEX16 [Octopus bimaculoides]|eukprot:XP_014777235.1 PREDICTED: peroxisomal membrane protein PEX16-like [Octopus bimaculoides]